MSFPIASWVIPRLPQLADIVKALPSDVSYRSSEGPNDSKQWPTKAILYRPKLSSGCVFVEYFPDKTLDISVSLLAGIEDFKLARQLVEAFQYAGKPVWAKWADRINDRCISEQKLLAYADECWKKTIEIVQKGLDAFDSLPPEEQVLIIPGHLRDVVLGPVQHELLRNKNYSDCLQLLMRLVKDVQYFDNKTFPDIGESAFRHASLSEAVSIGVLEPQKSVFIPHMVKWLSLPKGSNHDFTALDNRFLKVTELLKELPEDQAILLDSSQVIVHAIGPIEWDRLLQSTADVQRNLDQLLGELCKTQVQKKDPTPETIEKRNEELKQYFEQHIGQAVDGRYIIEGVLGFGGFGAVYKAKHILMDRPVALKILLSPDSPASLARFHREAMIISSLNHPNIVSVHDFGITANQMPYLALEFLNGETLMQRINSTGRIPCHEAMQYAYKICDALSYAHHRKIVHRDLKPENILLIGDDTDELCPKILDFGIAKMHSSEESRLTMGPLGTPQYMSPEQFRSSDIDGRSDIYSLACILIEMLTGKALVRYSEDIILMLEYHLAVKHHLTRS